MIELGDFSLRVALLMAVWSAVLSLLGGALARPDFIQSGTRGIHAAAAFTALAAAGLWWGLISGDFSLRYVATHTNEQLPVGFRISAFWAGRAGRLMLWNVCFSALSGCASIASFARRHARRLPVPTFVAMPAAALGTVLATSLGVSTLAASPFQRLLVVPADGRGLDPQLQHWATALDVPLLTMGWSAAAVAIVLLLTTWRSRGIGELGRIRAAPWTLVAFGALATSVELRAWWAYAHAGAALSAAALSATRPETLAAMLLLLAIALVSGRHRRLAWSLAVAGVALVGTGLVGQPFARTYDVMLSDGETFRANDAWGASWTFTSQGASRLERANYALTAVALLPARDGVRQPFIAGELRYFHDGLERDRFPAEGNPGLRSSLAQDLLVAIRDVGDGRAGLRIRFAPLVACVWIGGAVMIAAGLLALSPPRTSGPVHA